MKDLEFRYLRVSVEKKIAEVVDGLKIDKNTDLFLQDGSIKDIGNNTFIIRGYRREFFRQSHGTVYETDTFKVHPDFVEFKNYWYRRIFSLPKKRMVKGNWFFVQDENNDDIVEVAIKDCAIIKNYKK